MKSILRRRLGFESLENRELLSVNPLVPMNNDNVILSCATYDPPENADVQEAAGLEEAPYDYADTFYLHSNPGSNFTIYLDFNGHVTTDTYWNNTYGDVITTPAFSLDDDPSFSNAELERIQYIWQRVAEDYAPFDVNVTTEEPSPDKLIKSGTGDTAWGVRVAIGGDNSWYGSAGGVAYRTSFNYSTDTPCFVFTDNLGKSEKSIAEAITHEVGHTLGLTHDGTSTEGYYDGDVDGVWAPIMGVGYYSQVVQWSKGEYPDANNQEDDLSMITSNNGFTYRTDDHGNTRTAATALAASGGLLIGSGIIERNTDVDFFSFTLNESSTISISMKSGTRDANLDILAKLYNSSGTQIVTSNPVTSLDAEFYETLGAGTYYISVEGTGRDGYYSDYASIGTYTIDLEFVTETSDIGDTMASAQLITFSDNVYRATDEIGNGNNGAKDVDMFKLVVGAGDVGKTFAFETSLPTGVSSAEGADTYFRFFDASGNQLAYNDDGGSDYFSLLEFTPTAAGTYYLGVTNYKNTYYNPASSGSGSAGDTGLYTLTVRRTAGQEAASTIVTTELDVVDAYDGVTSLREAITAAGTGSLGTTITFAAGMKGKTIVLDTSKYANWNVTKDLTIDAGGMDITLDANGGRDSVYNYNCIVNSGVSTFIGLTVTGLNRDQDVYTCGGAIKNTGNLTLIDCRTVGNTTYGIGNRNVMTMINTLSYGNRASGIYCDNLFVTSGTGSLTIDNSTILGSISMNAYDAYPAIHVAVNNSIIQTLYFEGSSLQSIDIKSSLISRSYFVGDTSYIDVDANSLTGGYYSNSIDPKFVSYDSNATWTSNLWKSWNLQLQSTSPAVNAGNNALVPAGVTTDFAGNARFVGAAVDMGAYEYQSGVTNPPTAPANFTSTSQTSNSVTLSWTAQSNLTGYTLQYKKSAASTWTTWTPAPGTSATSATITGLEANTAYDFQLTATNASGSASSTTSATTLTVETSKTTVTTVLDVVDATDGVTSFREALAAAQPGDTIKFDESLRGKTLYIDAAWYGNWVINKDIVIDASGMDITLDGNQTWCVLDVSNCTAVLNGLKITNSTYNGINSSNATLTVTNCTISGNSGDGIYSSNSTLTVTESDISKNSGQYSSGIYSANDISVTITNCTVSENSEHGINITNTSGTAIVTNCIVSKNGSGGIRTAYIEGEVTVSDCMVSENAGRGISTVYCESAVTVTNCTITENVEDEYSGAGIFSRGCTLTVVGCTISGNSAATSGGGIYADDANTVTLINCTISGNSAGTSGGGIDNACGSMTVTNCTIADNTAVTAGGGIDSSGMYMTINNSIVAKNSSASSKDCYGYLFSGSNNLIGDGTGSNLTNGVNGNIVGSTAAPIDPKFVNASQGDYRLATGSSAINKGNNALAKDAYGNTLQYDLAGNARIVGGTVDIGAYEYQGDVVNPPTAPANFTSTAQTTNSITLSWTAQSGLTGYTLQYKKSADSNWSTWTAPGTASTSATITGLEANTAYNFRLTATNASGSASSTTNAATTGGQLTVPTLSIGTVTAYSVALSWTAVPNATGYVVERCLTGGSSWTTVANLSGSNNTNTTATGLAANTSYQFRVKATASGYGDSAYSSVKSATTAKSQLATPSITIGATTETTVALSWAAIPNATSYVVQRSTDGTNWATFSVTGTSATVSGLTGNTTYQFRVMATGSGYNESAYSAVKSTTTKSPLAAPTLSVGTITTNSIVLSWAAIPNATSYVIQQSTDGTNWGTFSVTGTSTTVGGLTEGTTYQFRIKAAAAGYNESAYSAVKSATTTTKAQLATPTLTIGAATTNSVALSWAAIPNATSYVIQRSTDGTNWATFGVTGTSTTAGGLTAGTTYQFRIKATGSGYNESDWSAVKFATTTPTAPANFTSTAQTANFVTLSWAGQSGLSGYTLEYKLSTSSNWTTWGTLGSTATSATVTGLEADKAYNFRLTAINVSGSASSTTSATTKALPSMPTNLAASSVTENSAQVSWTASSNATGYEIWYKVQGSANWMTQTLSGSSTKTCSLSGLSANTVYNIQVRAVNSGTGLVSNWAGLTLTTAAPATQPPAAPANLAVLKDSVSETGLTLTWSSQAGLTGYTLQYKKSSENVWTNYSTSISASASQLSVTGLEAGTKYDFRLVAKSAAGSSGPAELKGIETVGLGTNYAVLYAGGGNAASNSVKYYNAIKDLYTVLVTSYGLSQENIYVIYADGTNPGVDRADGTNSNMSFALSSNVFSATYTNLNSVFTTLGGEMTSNDHLLFLTYDHGGGTANNASKTGEEVLTGWGTNITDAQVASSVEKIQQGYVTMVFSQCFSGGILDNIFDPGTGKKLINTNAHLYGMSATNHYEVGWSGNGSGFAYAFINAIDPSYGNSLTTTQAFDYTLNHAVHIERDSYGNIVSYANNGGSYIITTNSQGYNYYQHPWQAGETFSIFVSGSNDSTSVDSVTNSGWSDSLIITNDATSKVDSLELIKDESVYINFGYSNPLGADVSATVSVIGGTLAQAKTVSLDKSAMTENTDGRGQLTTNLNLGTFGAGVYTVCVELLVNGNYIVFERTFEVADASSDISDVLTGAQQVVLGGTEFVTASKIGDGIYGGNDVDIYRFDISAGDVGNTLSFNSIAAASSLPVDTYLRLFSAAGTELACSVFSSEGLSSLCYTITSAATYYLAVSSLENTNYDPNVADSGSGGEIGEYRLSGSIAETKSDLSMYYDYSWIDNIVVAKTASAKTSDAELSTNDTIYINYKFTNSGYSTAGAVTNRITITGPGGYSRSQDFASTPLEVSEFQSLSENFNWGNLSAGDYTITVTLDVNGVLSELSEENNSASWQFTVEETQSGLNSPQNLRLAAAAQTTLSLDWNNVEDAAEYILQRKGPGETGFSQVYRGAASKYVDRGLTAGTGYEYRVQAVGSAFSDVLSVSTAASQVDGQDVADSPMILSTEYDAANNRNTITWTDLGSDYVYTVYKAGRIVVNAGDKAFYVDTSPAAAGTDGYTVMAYNTQLRQYSTVMTAVLHSTAPAVEITGVEFLKTGGVKLLWDAQPNTLYMVMQSGRAISGAGYLESGEWIDVNPDDSKEYILVALYQDSTGALQSTFSNLFSAKRPAQNTLAAYDAFWSEYGELEENELFA